MSTNKCEVIQDLLPLYIDNICSDESRHMVSEHLDSCNECKKLYQNMTDPVKQDLSESELDSEQAFKAIKRKLHKRSRIMIGITVFVTAIIVLLSTYFIGSGFMIRTDVALLDYSVSETGTEIILHTAVMSSMGYTRGFDDNGGGVKPHYLTFYSTFGGFNSSLGAKYEFELKVDEHDTEIWFNRADGGYELVLQKDSNTGEWVRPNK